MLKPNGLYKFEGSPTIVQGKIWMRSIGGEGFESKLYSRCLDSYEGNLFGGSRISSNDVLVVPEEML